MSRMGTVVCSIEQQASLSTAILFAAYIAQQRYCPYVTAATLSSGLQVGVRRRGTTYSFVATMLARWFYICGRVKTGTGVGGWGGGEVLKCW
jgi:hypothetical protein